MTLPRAYEDGLVERAKEDPAAFGELYDHYFGQIYRFVYSRIRNQEAAEDITAEVLARFSGTADPRLRQIMLSLINHLHAFVKEVQLTEAEWFQAIEILTEAGKMCSDKRQEFILFSDTLGVSMVVDLLDHRKPDGATESTVFGPFPRISVAFFANPSHSVPRLVYMRVRARCSAPSIR